MNKQLESTNRREQFTIGNDLRITKMTRRISGAGRWVFGTVAGYRFDALVFAKHAENAAWELGESRISKLWITRLDDKAAVFHWERGMNQAAESAETQAVVDFLAANLADLVFDEAGDKLAQFEEERKMNDIIYSYTRANALADGVLIDVSKMAAEAGIKYPVALTDNAWSQCVAVNETDEGQDEDGRLWDVLSMLRHAIRSARNQDMLDFQVLVAKGGKSPQPVTLRAYCGPGDDAEAVITVMIPGDE